MGPTTTIHVYSEQDSSTIISRNVSADGRRGFVQSFAYKIDLASWAVGFPRPPSLGDDTLDLQKW